jgi:hypothetical protein
MSEVGRGAIAGAVAGVAWRAAEPALRRLFGHPYADAGLATAFVARGRAETALQYAVQLAGGAAFGAVFVAAGGRTVRQAVSTVLAENAALWPLVGAVQGRHPHVRSGAWPPPFRDPRALAVSASGHALYGVLLGLLLRERLREGR